VRPVSKTRLKRSEVPKTAIRIALGDAMRSLRGERGYTQEKFAARVGIDRSYYGAIERAEFNASMDTIGKIARGLDVKVSELLRRARL
jgi:transcriptional regulator with XRE-family HTH domain